jgi:hypothetical protein
MKIEIVEWRGACAESRVRVRVRIRAKVRVRSVNHLAFPLTLKEGALP